MASGGLNNLSTDLLTPPWKTTPEFKDKNDSPGEVVNKDAKTAGKSKSLQTKDGKLQSINVVDWTENAVNGEHLWTNADSSGHSCCIPDNECTKSGPKVKCTACKVVVHVKCMDNLERVNIKCKVTFREGSRRFNDEEFQTRHHWVYQRKYNGKCSHCGKSFHTRSVKDIVAMSCSWCKCAYHFNNECAVSPKENSCTMGQNRNLIVPPSWVVKLPIKRFRRCRFSKLLRQWGDLTETFLNPFKTLFRNSSIKKRHTRRRSGREKKAFAVRPVVGDNRSPLLVFVNPRSGGNQGAKIIRKFQWLLNPRQVFDLSQVDPKFGLQLYRRVPNLRILACGGDGTVGWILSQIDTLQISPFPPVSILPLGTGNDLSRVLNWGGGYTDEPMERILNHLEEAEVVQLDRWNLQVSENGKAKQEQEPNSVSKLPLDVMNNYCSVGADAEVTLEFHESREANPDKFTNRFYSLYFYGKCGGRKVIQRRSRNLFRHVKLVCDGIDLSEKIAELKPQCLLFLNISSYGAGTSPWGHPLKEYEEFKGQRSDDGFMEVIGLTSTSLATTRVGGHGLRISQCQTAVLTTHKVLPFQVDGEPCRLLPSIITINLRNQANMIKKIKKNSNRGNSNPGSPLSPVLPVSTKIYMTSFEDYKKNYHDIKKIAEVSTLKTTVNVESRCDLKYLRILVDEFLNKENKENVGEESWCFLDASYSDRVYRIDPAQEGLYDVADILEDGIFIVNINEEEEAERRATEDALTQELIKACSEGNLSKVQSFQHSGVSLSRADIYGRSPLHYAVINNRPKIVEYIVNHVSTSALNQVDDTGQTALHKATVFRLPSLCTALVQAGADIARKDYNGNTAAMIATEMGNDKLANYLMEQEKSQEEDSDEQETSV